MDFLEDMSKIIIPLVLIAGAAYVACQSVCAWVQLLALLSQMRWRSA